MNVKDILFELSRADGVGSVRAASDIAFEMLSSYMPTEKGFGLTVSGMLQGKTDYTLMLEAHIDQIAMTVTNVDENGFLTVANAGGIDVRMLPTRRVTVHGRKKISAVFCGTPPHLADGKKEYGNITEIKLDTLLGGAARETVSAGDFVTFSGEPHELLNGKLFGRSFDDRTAIACLIKAAERLSAVDLPFNVAFVFSDSEELGMRGVRPAAFKLMPDEAIAVDVSFGNGIGIREDECGKLGQGGMIGIAPVLDRNISKRLIEVAERKNIPYQLEAMGERSGTDADMISVTGCGIRTGTLSIPLRNMHTEVEVVDTKDLEAVCELLCEYVLHGGVMDA